MFRRRYFYVVGISLLVLLTGLGLYFNRSDVAITPVPNTSLSEKEQVLAAADNVVASLSVKDFKSLSDHVGQNGLYFSPYSYLHPDSDLKFSQAEVSKLLDNTEKMNWGSYDGSGAPIFLTPLEYYDRFIYDSDFAHASQINYDLITTRGNTIVNLKEIFPTGKVVEYHIPGTDSEYEGMDWKTLWLVFTKEEEKYYLRAIAHDEWTI